MLYHILSAAVEGRLNEMWFEGASYLLVYIYVKVTAFRGAGNFSRVLRQDGETLCCVSSGP